MSASAGPPCAAVTLRRHMATQATRPHLYFVLMWQIDSGYQEAAGVEGDLLAVLQGRDYALLTGNVALIGVRYDAEPTEVFSIVNHLATKKWQGRLGFVMSPILVGPAVWAGWMAADWAAINRITGVIDTPPPLPAANQ
jgi:hypothetical protein